MSLGPLITTFSPPPRYIPSSMTHYEPPGGWDIMGPIDISGDCFLLGYEDDAQQYYSPGICPAGYTMACAYPLPGLGVGQTSVTTATCCSISSGITLPTKNVTIFSDQAAIANAFGNHIHPYNGGLSTGATIGACVGVGVAALLLIGGLIFALFMRRRRLRTRTTASSQLQQQQQHDAIVKQASKRPLFSESSSQRPAELKTVHPRAELGNGYTR
ncbi:hypothetical protein F5Y16DRAFT_409294 [Xylariaceae sp. FL0255]|nr:hypothetical protein F5Y16DRAFT_409294 [Xylariaceae sp. FL0255]